MVLIHENSINNKSMEINHKHYTISCRIIFMYVLNILKNIYVNILINLLKLYFFLANFEIATTFFFSNNFFLQNFFPQFFFNKFFSSIFFFSNFLFQNFFLPNFIFLNQKCLYLNEYFGEGYIRFIIAEYSC